MIQNPINDKNDMVIFDAIILHQLLCDPRGQAPGAGDICTFLLRGLSYRCFVARVILFPVWDFFGSR
jgi:hypothetical protein